MHSSEFNRNVATTLHWIARIAGIAAIIPLMMIVFGEPGTGPNDVREWPYLALFPFGFSAGYLIGWRWPLAGGAFSLSCMLLSLVVIGRTFGLGPYVIWSVLTIPALLFIAAGMMKRDGGKTPAIASA